MPCTEPCKMHIGFVHVCVWVCVRGTHEEYGAAHAYCTCVLYMYIGYYICASSCTLTFSDIHSLVPSRALYITLAYFTAVLNRGQNSNEKELS